MKLEALPDNFLFQQSLKFSTLGKQASVIRNNWVHIFQILKVIELLFNTPLLQKRVASNLR